MEKEVIIVIPARYGSTRLPGKPLRKIAGKPMIEHVYRRAIQNSAHLRVVVATDNDIIRQTVLNFGGECLLTDPNHPTGCDRVAEVARKIPAQIYVNLQGDEPLIHPEMINEVLKPFQTDKNIMITTLKSHFPETENFSNPHLVKVVVDLKDYALYFSRSPIPFLGPNQLNGNCFLHHGIYAFRKEALLAFADSPPTPLEKCERLEQLRFLELGFQIKAPTTYYHSLGVDTEEDLRKIETIISSHSFS